MKINIKVFEKSIIAQDDDCDYDESGYVACVFEDGSAAIFNYSHCSCYGTWEALSGQSDYYWAEDTTEPEDREIHPVWEGRKEELYVLAKAKMDPSHPGRPASEEDYDYDHLMKVYKQVLEKLG